MIAMMKHIRFSFSILLVWVISYALLNLSFKKDTIRQTGINKGFAVVELFTSEGCSSCSPADAAFQTIAASYREDVYLLGFHVDYWNNLGWEDKFSNELYSKRQRKYASMINGSSVYTPQVVVNGQQQFVGSDLQRLNKEIKLSLKGQQNAAPVLKVIDCNDKTVGIAYTLAESTSGVLNVALVQSHAVSNVKKGENEGRRLTHVNIVRALKTIAAKEKSGKVVLDMPSEIVVNDCKIIAYLQDSNNLKITGAASINLK